MEIDLRKEIEEQLTRLKTLADDAVADDEESYSSRASALTALSKLLKQLTKDLQKVINMERLQKTEQAIIEVFEETASDEQKELFIARLRSLQTDDDHEQEADPAVEEQEDTDIVILDDGEIPEGLLDE